MHSSPAADHPFAEFAEAIVRGDHQTVQWSPDRLMELIDTIRARLLRLRDPLRCARFLSCCAAHTADRLDLSALAAATGITPNTAKDWLAALEQGGLVQLLPGWAPAWLRSRPTRQPLLHVTDSALLCWLQGVADGQALARHPARYRIATSWLVGACRREDAFTDPATLYHFRSVGGRQVPLIRERDGDRAVDLVTLALDPMPQGLFPPTVLRAMIPHGIAIAGLRAGLRRDGPQDLRVWPAVVHAGPRAHMRYEWHWFSWRAPLRLSTPAPPPAILRAA